ncbi:3,4-dehydroadipyl-CoA semialdehyde dehydrogenase [Pseudacidovorax sp. RU35E]|uniref:3,4-dehydroadipyl-CoA semialdehyde dehydrogenase n=1 Tax=Pseudacidovorax sp. RU35E TaxID=1907403 RepID=UPI000954A831|nr:3,4-dehydroadipyl-CoA semialdehyde dehydrogenase [Pseudacidovorax sp. RU35E]SIQ32107.1 3,4-dehydroadipyl-CoA semialdehyde dehydrogenase [Pseudacidovorax sp. RU35E]
MTTELLQNHVAGRWQAGTGAGTPLFDPVLGTALVRVDATGLDLPAAFAFARQTGGAALRALSYRERAGLLAAVVKVLQANRDAYYEIATANSGTVKNDSAVDIDGGIFTLGQYAKWGESLGDAHALKDGEPVRLGREPVFQSQHVQVPVQGVALFINAFNFPAWGLWEKAAPALLSGVPVIVKPATATAWLTQRMVRDVIEAGVLPPGALSVVCGSSAGLMDALTPFDLVSFTGSADTAALIRGHAAVARHSVRANIEADSLNSALLLPGDAPGDAVFDLLVKEVVREMTVKSGQKCTAIRRVLVPEALYAPVAEAVSAKLAKVSVGNPRNESVRMGSLVSREQLASVQQGLQQLEAAAEVLHDGRRAALVDCDPAVAACIGPVLLGARDADGADVVHDVEVFGPVATLLPYRDLPHALALADRGLGSLVASVYGSDPAEIGRAALALAASHGRVHAVTPEVAQAHTGHGNVMPMSLHGGPGRAGGGAELGGLRALDFYHRRAAVQASPAVLDALVP